VCLKSRITSLQLILPRSLREHIPSRLSGTLKDRFLDLLRFLPPMKFAGWHLRRCVALSARNDGAFSPMILFPRQKREYCAADTLLLPPLVVNICKMSLLWSAGLIRAWVAIKRQVLYGFTFVISSPALFANWYSCQPVNSVISPLNFADCVKVRKKKKGNEFSIRKEHNFQAYFIFYKFTF